MNNPMLLKLTALLAQYLYNHKRLDLPGIGSFFFDSSARADIDPSKPGAITHDISFAANPSLREAPELVNYISNQTGKMRPLAIADLETHLELAKQFLNTGKAFLFEGIGTLSKEHSGAYNFKAGTIISEKTKEQSTLKLNDASTKLSNADYKSILYNKKKSFGWKKSVSLLFVMAGLGFTVLAGYTIYRKKVDSRKEIVKEETKAPELVAAARQVEPPPVKDTTAVVAPSPSAYKFVIESAEKRRAIKRYEWLKSNGFAIEIQTQDSLNFDLYFRIPASASDTTHILDSLQNFYTPAGKKAFIAAR